MLRVMQCILEEQREFFEEGVAHLKPMTLRSVAGRLGLHESTIARVTRVEVRADPARDLPFEVLLLEPDQDRFTGQTPRRVPCGNGFGS